MAWVFAHLEELGGDKERIFLSGHSAGAQLAALLGTNLAYLKKYNISPPELAGVIPVDTASFDLLSKEYNERLTRRLIKAAFGSDRGVLKKASPFL
ncbi:alpha/beta hydrolase fold domain-containing protein [Desulfatibacillum aliphaticivorans]|uniref:alpha/beta hydrolase n=1 Tax=Desulfatibacillum aliphaticivorans TaxID=218208 RepID=UPI0004160B6B